MRRLIYLALFLSGLLLRAQTTSPTFQYVSVIPAGTCVGTPPIQIMYLTGFAYSCNNGTWGNFAGNGSGGGGTPIGPAGGGLAGFYPNPILAVSQLPNGMTAFTQAFGDTGLSVATDQFVTANSFPSPMTTAGDIIVGGTSGVAARLAANASAGQAVLTSTSGAQGPTTKTCAAQTGFPGTGNSTTCTLSISASAGESVFVGVYQVGSGSVFTVTDSAADTFASYGTVHHNSVANLDVQTFYSSPLAAPITSVTVSVPSGGSYLAVMADTANNMAPSGITDGQAVADGASSPLSTPTITTTTNGDYLFCVAASDATSGLSAGAGFTQGSRLQPPIYVALTQYLVQGSAGPITPTVIGSIGVSATLQCSAFKPSPALVPITSWTQSPTLNNIQAPNTEVIPVGADPTGTTDSRAAIQSAITLAISQTKAVYIPAGHYLVSCPGGGAPALTFPSISARIHGAATPENGYFGDNAGSYIQATGACTTLQVGPGTQTAQDPSGWVRDIGFTGNGIPALGSPTGNACLQIDGIPGFVVDGVSCANQDVGYYLINNPYGAHFSNIRGCFSGSCNAGFYLPSAGTSAGNGSDNTFENVWVNGAFCAMCITSGTGGIHVKGGQWSVQAAATCDTCGSFVLGFDYLTQTTPNLGGVGIDLDGVSFENLNNSWAIRASVQTNISTSHINVFNYGGHTDLGFYKNTSTGASQLSFRDTNFYGTYSNSISGCPMVSLAGVSAGFTALEENTTIPSGTLCGTSIPNSATYFSLFDQSSQQAYATIISPKGVNLPGLGNSTPLLLSNDNTGHLQTSANGGSTYTPLFTNPLTTIGDIPYEGVSGMTRLPANSTAAVEVLVSQAASGTPVPTTYTCGAAAGGSGNSQSCTWSTPPPIGNYVACGATNANAAAMTMTDSGGNTYSPIASLHTLWNGGLTRTFYFGPLASSITTTTVNTSVGNFLALKCQSTTFAVAFDAQCIGDVTTGTAIPCGSALTTGQNNEYVFCAGLAASGTLSAGSGFTLGSTDYGADSANQYKVQSTAGSFTPSITNSVSTNASMTCTAFNSAGTAPPTLTNSPALSFANMSGAVNATSIATSLYTVSSGTGHPALPAASSVAAGTTLTVTDSTSISPGTCVGGSTHWVQAISDGTNWNCP